MQSSAFKFLLVCLTLLGASSFARKNDGVRVQLGVGKPTLEVTNPDDTKVNYTGLAGSLRGYIPLLTTEKFRTDLTGTLRYLDFENTNNNSTQSEYAQYIGPSAGLETSIYGFFVGAEYVVLKGRHISVGQFSRKIEFDLTSTNIYYGFRFNLGLGSIGVSTGKMSSTIPKDKTDLSTDSPWKASDVFLEFTYTFEMSTGKFISSIFGK